MSNFLISKKIEIDAAHRIPDTNSKCKSLHGHRYTITATCEGSLAESGTEKGMAGGLDFSFLKQSMVDVIDYHCDHGLILCKYDPLVENSLSKEGWCDLDKPSHYYSHSSFKDYGKLYVIADPPTAEVLARHWYYRLYSLIQGLSNNQAELHSIEVQETPSCSAVYSNMEKQLITKIAYVGIAI